MFSRNFESRIQNFLKFVYFTNQVVLPKGKQIRAAIIFLLVEQKFGIRDLEIREDM